MSGTYRLTTPWGVFRAVFSDAGLREFHLPVRHVDAPELRGQEGVRGTQLRDALKARLRGKTCDLPWEFFDLSGRAPFHVRVWRALYAIPRGQVRSYGGLAAAAGAERGARAAGQACGANPIALFIPCHRAVAAGGGLGGFGGGLGMKKRLLALEGSKVPAES